MKLSAGATDKEKRNLILSKFDVHSYEYKEIESFLDEKIESITLDDHEEKIWEAKEDTEEEIRKELEPEIEKLEEENEELKEENEKLKKALEEQAKR